MSSNLVFGLFFFAWVATFWYLLGPKRLPASPPIKPVVALVVDMLGVKQGWESDRYTMNHQTGLKMWIANGAYGLSLELDTKGMSLPNPDNQNSDSIELTNEEREILWAAIKKHARLDQKVGIESFALRAQAFAEQIAEKKLPPPDGD